MSKKLLITGSTGFLGSHLIKRLKNEDYELICIKRSTSDLSRVEKDLSSPKIKFYDIDKTNLEKIFVDENITAIIHTATEYGRNNGSISKVIEANIALPIQLIELGIKHGTKSFLNTDSYFNKNMHLYSSLIHYSLSKKSLLSWLKILSKDIKVVNLVLEHIYGPLDRAPKFVESMIENIAIKKVPQIPLTHGHQKRDFVYVSDVVDAYVMAIKYSENNDFHFKNFEVGTGQSFEVRKIPELIKRLSHSPTKLDFGALEYKSDEIMDSKADNLDLLELGWIPKVSLEEGISKILSSYAANREEST